MKKHATTDKPLIVFATIAAGGGHVATANAMAQSLGAGYPDTFDTRVTELMVELGFGEQDQKHKNTWSWMLAHPWSARWGQRIIDRLPKLTNRYLRGTLDAFARAAADHLNSLSPALVVTNHGWLTIALTLAQERYGLKPKLVHFATDPLDASALWAEWRVSRYIVPSASVQRDLERFGVPPGVIDRIGYPVGQTFLNPPSQAAAREKLGLEPRYTCLVSLGGEGVGANVLAVVRALEASPLNPQIVVVTGRNEALRRKLDALPDIRTLGYVSNVADYLAACDVVVGKAGPASVLEALAVGRPVLMTSYAGLNEEKLVRFVTAKDLGAYVPRAEGLAAQLEHYAQPEVHERVARESEALRLPEMTTAFADYLSGVAWHGFPDTPIKLPGLH